MIDGLKKWTYIICSVLFMILMTSCLLPDIQKNRESEIITQMPVIIPAGEPAQKTDPPDTELTEENQTYERSFQTEVLSDLSIEGAVFSALQNNKDLKIQKLEPVIAGTFEKIERASFDPEIFAEITYAKADDINSMQTTNEQLVKDTSTSAVVGIRQTFPTGTTLEMDGIREQGDTDDIENEEKIGITLSLTQSLLNGLSLSANLARIRQAALDAAISSHELRGYAETIVADTEIAYWEYVLAKRKIVIFEQSLGIASTQLDEIEQQIRVGILPKTEAAAARSEVALREQDVIDACSAAEVHRLKLLQLIIDYDGSGFDIVPGLTSKPEIEIQPVNNLEERIQLAEKKRSDLNEARMRLKQNRLETMMTKNGMLPKLDFFMTLGRMRYHDDSFDIENTDLDEVRAGFRLTHVLGNRESNAKHTAAWASRRQAGIAVENLLSTIHLDVRLAVNEVMRAGKQVGATRVTRIFQAQTYTAEKDRFDVGSSTALMVSQARRDLMEARIAEVEAVVNFRIALIRLYLAEGSLLDMRGVKIVRDGAKF